MIACAGIINIIFDGIGVRGITMLNPSLVGVRIFIPFVEMVICFISVTS